MTTSRAFTRIFFRIGCLTKFLTPDLNNQGYIKTNISLTMFGEDQVKIVILIEFT